LAQPLVFPRRYAKINVRLNRQAKEDFMTRNKSIRTAAPQTAPHKGGPSHCTTFDELLKLVSPLPGLSLPGLCADSRQVNTGDVFVAVKGTHQDGHNFIPQAITRGAAYIVCQQPRDCRPAQAILVKDSAEALGLLSQASSGWPCRKLTNLAVTGTNGKTTVAFLVRSVITCAHHKCCLIGTVVYDTAAALLDAPLTTPDAPLIAGLARSAATAGASYLIIEASSHALSQNRLAGIDFKAAAFTNLTGDHLDYHQDMQKYLAAKARLFEQLSTDAVAVLNRNCPAAELIAQHTKARKLWFGLDCHADLTTKIESADMAGTVFTLHYAGKNATVRTPLAGRHNVSNHLAAAGLCIAAGFELPTIAAGLTQLMCVPGRLEPVSCGQDFAVLIDYAHTDDALKNVLETLRPLCKGRLILVFGCGGDRDRTKRPRMAKVAEQLADFIIVTSDNPRTEPPQQIINEILSGFSRLDTERIKVQPDRTEAIRLAISAARTDDIVLIAGKGHETCQIVGSRRFDFSDKTTARAALEDLR
jgi:UDP-N-acetylmuramoyl-L-alanyl-D-glutamate--2,6-diaminopimelate ligase